jgi:glycosyltransferase involved in cell wall biosynthesis
VANFDRLPDYALRSKLTDGRELPVIFTAARLHNQKGHAHLLEAAALVPDALFLLAGDGPERARLEGRARQLGIEGRVRFLGQRRDIPELLAICDLFVLPSLYEGLPLSLLEAMAAGKPVIAAAIPGNDEIIIDGKTGLLVPPGSAADLAASIRRLLSDSALAAQFAEAGKDRVVRNFSAQAMAGRVTQIYDELLESRYEAN